MIHLQPPEDVVATTKIKFISTSPKLACVGQIVQIESFSVVLKQIRINRKTSSSGKEQPLVLGRDSKETLVGLEPERDRLSDKLRILLGGEHVAIAREGVSEEMKN